MLNCKGVGFLHNGRCFLGSSLDAEENKNATSTKPVKEEKNKDVKLG